MKRPIKNPECPVATNSAPLRIPCFAGTWQEPKPPRKSTSPRAERGGAEDALADAQRPKEGGMSPAMSTTVMLLHCSLPGWR
jgi:hypothetical protein